MLSRQGPRLRAAFVLNGETPAPERQLHQSRGCGLDAHWNESPLKRAAERGGEAFVNRPYKDRPIRIKPRKRGLAARGESPMAVKKVDSQPISARLALKTRLFGDRKPVVVPHFSPGDRWQSPIFVGSHFRHGLLAKRPLGAKRVALKCRNSRHQGFESVSASRPLL